MSSVTFWSAPSIAAQTYLVNSPALLIEIEQWTLVENCADELWTFICLVDNTTPLPSFITFNSFQPSENTNSIELLVDTTDPSNVNDYNIYCTAELPNA